MPYFSLSNKYRSPMGLDPSMKRWANGLPLSTIQGELEASNWTGGFNGGGAMRFNKVNKDTASFFPTLFSTPPPSEISGVTIPPQAGGMYIYSVYVKYLVGQTGSSPSTLRGIIYRSGLQQPKPWVPGTTPGGSTEWARDWQFRSLTVLDFLYLNPGDMLCFFNVPHGVTSLEKCVFRFARLTV